MFTVVPFFPPTSTGNPVQDVKNLGNAIVEYLGKLNGDGALAIAQHSAWTPTATAETGSFTTVSATGFYWLLEKRCFYEAKIVITTVGTATGACLFTLPFKNVARETVGYGRETVAGGKQLTVTIDASGTTGAIRNYDNTTPNASGATLLVAGSYQIAP